MSFEKDFLLLLLIGAISITSFNFLSGRAKAAASSSLILLVEGGTEGGESLAFCATSGALASMPMSSL